MATLIIEIQDVPEDSPILSRAAGHLGPERVAMDRILDALTDIVGDGVGGPTGAYQYVLHVVE